MPQFYHLTSLEALIMLAVATLKTLTDPATIRNLFIRGPRPPNP
jgi:hypothetical protein